MGGVTGVALAASIAVGLARGLAVALVVVSGFALIGTVALVSGILWAVEPATNLPPHFHVLSGGVMLGACFMATDMVTSPLSRKGQLYYGIGCGALTALIRFYAGYPEGVCYSILLMNTLRPYIERISRPRILGEHKETKD